MSLIHMKKQEAELYVMHGQMNTTVVILDKYVFIIIIILKQMAITARLITAAGKLKTLKTTSHHCPLITRTVYYTITIEMLGL